MHTRTSGYRVLSQIDSSSPEDTNNSVLFFGCASEQYTIIRILLAYGVYQIYYIIPVFLETGKDNAEDDELYTAPDDTNDDRIEESPPTPPSERKVCFLLCCLIFCIDHFQQQRASVSSEKFRSGN